MCTFLTCIEMEKYVPSHIVMTTHQRVQCNERNENLILLHTLGFKKATKAKMLMEHDLQI